MDLLRDHPLMSRYGVPNWPPVWTWIDGKENVTEYCNRPIAEIGSFDLSHTL